MRLVPFSVVAPLAFAAAPLWADGCPEAPDHAAAQDALFAELQTAAGDMEARVLSQRLWGFWTDAPDGASQEMLDRGMRARSSYDFVTALERFDALVGYCPFYAEGYNQRAFVRFLQGAYAAALPDLDQALELNPRHVGALSGKALTLMALGREAEGQTVLRAALALNPWLSERGLLKPLPGDDL